MEIVEFAGTPGDFQKLNQNIPARSIVPEYLIVGDDVYRALEERFSKDKDGFLVYKLWKILSNSMVRFA